MAEKKILVLGAQVPFVRGGAELLNESLVTAINERIDGVRAELVQLPFKWYPEAQLIKDMAAWRLVDITETNGNKIDLCIATKYPTYLARHDNKVTWLVHQHRVFYDLEGSEYDHPHCPDIDKIVRQKVRDTDATFLNESKKIFTISGTVSSRLSHYNGVDSQPLYPPPKLSEKIRTGGFGDYILYIGRVEKIKRIEPLISALATNPVARARIVGTGEHLDGLRKLARELGVADRCIFEGYVADDRYIELLAQARAVYYGPLGEDYGYATVEAFLAGKPVLTLSDSGEVARIVEKTQSGWVAETDTDQLAGYLGEAFAATDAQLAAMAEAGSAFARDITWENVLQKLVVPFL